MPCAPDGHLRRVGCLFRLPVRTGAQPERVAQHQWSIGAVADWRAAAVSGQLPIDVRPEV